MNWSIDRVNGVQTPQTSLNGDGDGNQIFVDGQMMIYAQYPSTSLDVSNPTKMTAAANAYTADTGTLVGSPVWTSGQSGSALQFNGSNQYVTVPNSLDLNITSDTMTIACWAQSAASTWNGSNPTFASMQGDYAFGPYGNYGVQVQLCIGGNWHQAYYNPGSAHPAALRRGITMPPCTTAAAFNSTWTARRYRPRTQT